MSVLSKALKVARIGRKKVCVVDKKRDTIEADRTNELRGRIFRRRSKAGRQKSLTR